MQPFYAIVVGIIYIGSIYLLVRKEKRYISYSITIFLSLLQLSFLFLWFEKLVFLMTTQNVGFKAYEAFSTFVTTSYFVLFIPQLVVFAWYGIKKNRHTRSISLIEKNLPIFLCRCISWNFNTGTTFF